MPIINLLTTILVGCALGYLTCGLIIGAVWSHYELKSNRSGPIEGTTGFYGSAIAFRVVATLLHAILWPYVLFHISKDE